MCFFCVFSGTEVDEGRVMITLVWSHFTNTLFYPAVKQWQRRVKKQSQREWNVV